jgi:hypothetical protein
MRNAALPCSLVLLTTLACAEDPPADELDLEGIRELSSEQGSATGNEWTGTYASSITTESCDCPSVALAGTTIDLCSMIIATPFELELTQADGFLLVPLGDAMLTGAIEADDSFVIAGEHDLSTLLGPIQLLGRMDGTLRWEGDEAKLSASVGQRLIGEVAGDTIDCRALGQVEATRIE